MEDAYKNETGYDIYKRKQKKHEQQTTLDDVW